MLLFHRRVNNNMNNSDYAIVVAHPDDEIIFANSIIENAAKIIICFREVSGNKFLSLNRKKIEPKYPYKKVFFLGIKQPSNTWRLTNWENPKYTQYGIYGRRNYKEQMFNYFKIKQKLEELLSEINIIYTHSSWGEYGHEEHIQLNKIVNDLALKNNKVVRTFGYASSRTFNLMLNKLSKMNLEIEKKKTNKNLFIKIKRLYIENNCWTFYDEFKLPEHEFFIQENGGNNTGNTISCNIINYMGEDNYIKKFFNNNVKYYKLKSIIYLIYFFLKHMIIKIKKIIKLFK